MVATVLALLLAIVLTATAAPGAGASATTSGACSTSPYAPPDRPGPPLDVPAGDLAARLACTGNVTAAAREPVLLVADTALTPDSNFSWNYERRFSELRLPTAR